MTTQIVTEHRILKPEVRRVSRMHHDVEDRHNILVGSEVTEQLQLPQYPLRVAEVSKNILHLLDRDPLTGNLSMCCQLFFFSSLPVFRQCFRQCFFPVSIVRCVFSVSPVFSSELFQCLSSVIFARFLPELPVFSTLAKCLETCFSSVVTVLSVFSNMVCQRFSNA